MYKKVMVAIDGSETARRALTEAQNIANSYNADLCIVHAITNDSEVNKKTGANLLQQAESEVDALSIETQLLMTEPQYGLTGIAEAIAAAVEKWGADILVVGTANRRGLEHFVVGSVAEQLLAKVDTSILLVRPQ